MQFDEQDDPPVKAPHSRENSNEANLSPVRSKAEASTKDEPSNRGKKLEDHQDATPSGQRP